MKKNYGRKERRRSQRKFNKYVPGKLGISAVSEFIMQDYGYIASRRERKRLARERGVPFVGYRSY